jgi:hypothetical protein
VRQVVLRSPVALIASTLRRSTIYPDLYISYSFTPLIFNHYFLTDHLSILASSV